MGAITRLGRRLVLGVLVVSCTELAACAPPIDLATGLEVQDVSTGWLDAGVVNGNNKLVPKVSFKLHNVSGQSLSMLQVNALFRRVGDQEEWGSGFATAAGSQGLGAGASTDVLLLKSPLGYTGSDPRLAMLTNSHFVDAEVDLFAKYGSGQWAQIGRYAVQRHLVEP
jgi:hypothetical protein